MKLLLIFFILSAILFFAFYGGYYLFYPSQLGEDIVLEKGMPYPAVLAHRGSSIVAPESTAAAYIMAREKGSDYLEADLQQTSDGEIVVFHNMTLERTSNIEEVFPERINEQVGNFTYEELQKLDFGSWFNERFPDRAREEYEGLEIITLDDLIDIAEQGDNNPGLALEFKHPYLHQGMEENVVQILEERGWLGSEFEEKIKNNSDETDVMVGKSPARIIFFSFVVESLEKVKELAPDKLRLLLVNDNMIGRRSWRYWLDVADGLAHGLGPKGFMSWPWHIAAAHDRGLFVFPFVINYAWQAKIMSQFRADGYITDSPEVILNFLDRFYGVVDFFEND